MAERKYTHGLKLTRNDAVTIISIGSMEIWDGADLSLIRDTIARVVNSEDCRVIGIDVQHVQHMPSGFFGMLFDWYEAGVDIQLHSPRLRVMQMLWFRKFFYEVDYSIFQIYDGVGVNEVISENLWAPSESFSCLSAITIPVVG